MGPRFINPKSYQEPIKPLLIIRSFIDPFIQPFSRSVAFIHPCITSVSQSVAFFYSFSHSVTQAVNQPSTNHSSSQNSVLQSINR